MASMIKKSNGELLVKQIHDAMWEKNLTVQYVAEKTKISRVTLYKYLRLPGLAPLAVLLRVCRVCGIQQITLVTGGTYEVR